MSRRAIVPVVAFAVGLGAILALAARTQQPPQPGPDNKPTTGNVRGHGAKGDGTTDDGQAIQKAVDASGGVVTLPPGTYRITKPVVIDLSKVGFTAIRGEGVARVLMADEGPAFKFVGTHGGTAEPKSVKDGVWAKERMPCIDGIEIVGDHDNADGIEASGTMQLTITRVLVRKCRHGIHLTGRNRNALIADCHIYQNRGIGVYLDAVNLHQISVTGCHVSYCEGGGIVCKAGEVRNLQITGCDIESNHGDKGPPTANVLIDSTGGSNAEVAITGNTIQHNHVAHGSANIRIKGPSDRKLKDTEELRDGHITITGNVVSDVKVNVHLDHARGVVITGNTFWTGYEYNLLAEHVAAVTVGANNFDRNPRYASEEKPETTNAIAFRDCSDCTLSGFTLSGVRATEAGLTLTRCARFNVGNVTILDCDDAGLMLKDVTNSRVAGCLIRDDRPEAKSVSLRTAGGRGNMIVDNYLGRPSDILKGVGLVDRNYDGDDAVVRVVSRTLGYTWALPNTFLGVCFIPLALLSGGGVRVERGAVEIYGGLVRAFLVKMCRGAGCMTLGHTILGQNREKLDIARDHEHVHVEQYMRWGPLFLPMYGSSFRCWRKGMNVYFDNRFEKEAHARHYCP